ncbi:hypothetical protein [Paucibacter sp. XJ19-41]|uniref:hypothetical protein n=1 Tax=Paucibacter sp. XJ19-41 TaxID=2927824 RepID=UPI00234B4F0D|nr:hypothetical protein [Paucibacter sp. XJ19-41]MDC6167515.1 hypothetical protein [Paucibacter sp. XJ19-41]
MKVSKTLTTISAAAALVGAIGLAYAQTSEQTPASTNSQTLPTQPAAGTQQPSTQTPPVDNSTPAPMSTSPAYNSGTSNDNAPLTERAPRADRN